MLKSKIISHEIDNLVNDPFAPAIIKASKSRTFSGEVGADGKWITEAAGGWLVSKRYLGVYVIEHLLCNQNFSINIASLENYVNAYLAESHDMYFVIETKKDGELVDAPFSFSISFTEAISPAAIAKASRQLPRRRG